MGVNRIGHFSKKNLELALEFAVNDFKLKYKNTYFGYLWSIVSPLLMLLTLYAVFTYVIKLDLPHYQMFLLTGIIIWNFFSEATTRSISSLIEKTNVLRTQKIDPIMIVVGSCISSLISLFISFFVFLIMLYVFKLHLRPIGLITIIYVLMLFILTLGISLIITSIYSYFKDITHIWSFLLLIGFWLSPIVYSETVLPADILKVYMLNPLARIISHTRNSLIYNYLDDPYQILITLALSVLILGIGLISYKISSKGFGERL